MKDGKAEASRRRREKTAEADPVVRQRASAFILQRASFLFGGEAGAVVLKVREEFVVGGM